MEEHYLELYRKKIYFSLRYGHYVADPGEGCDIQPIDLVYGDIAAIRNFPNDVRIHYK